jgi:hypothetical protein
MAVNIWSASQDELKSINGVGEKTATSIIDLRESCLSQGKPLTTELLGTTCRKINASEWQKLINEGKVTLEKPVSKPKVDDSNPSQLSPDDLHKFKPPSSNGDSMWNDLEMFKADLQAGVEKLILRLSRRVELTDQKVSEFRSEFMEELQSQKRTIDAVDSNYCSLKRDVDYRINSVKNQIDGLNISVNGALSRMNEGFNDRIEKLELKLGEMNFEESHKRETQREGRDVGYKQSLFENSIQFPTEQTSTAQSSKIIVEEGQGILANVRNGRYTPDKSATPNIKVSLNKKSKTDTTDKDKYNKSKQHDVTDNSITGSSSDSDSSSNTDSDFQTRRRKNKKHRNRSHSPPMPKMPSFSGKSGSITWRNFHDKFERTADRRNWGKTKRLDKLFDCLSETALEYALKSEYRHRYQPLIKDLKVRFDLRDTAVAARQKLHMVKQTDDESEEDFLQRVLSLASDGYDFVGNSATQQLATEAFLRGLKHKDVAVQVMNKGPKTVQEACTLVKDILANNKAILGGKVSFKERFFTYEEDKRISSLEDKVDKLGTIILGKRSPTPDSRNRSNRRESPPPRSYRDSDFRTERGRTEYRSYDRPTSRSPYRDQNRSPFNYRGSPYRENRSPYRDQYRYNHKDPYSRSKSPLEDRSRFGDRQGRSFYPDNGSRNNPRSQTPPISQDRSRFGDRQGRSFYPDNRSSNNPRSQTPPRSQEKQEFPRSPSQGGVSPQDDLN